MIWELFLVGTFWFWAIIIVESFWLMRCLYEESGTGIMVSLIVLSLGLWLFGDFNVFAWTWNNPIFLLKCAAAYFTIGIVWSVTRFKLLCIDTRDFLEDTKQEFMSLEGMHPEGSVPELLREKWREFAGNKTWPGKTRAGVVRNMADVIPKPREYKATIMYWLAYWPLSMLWFFFHDLIERIAQRIYRCFVKLYESIARDTFINVKDDFGEE